MEEEVVVEAEVEVGMRVEEEVEMEVEEEVLEAPVTLRLAQQDRKTRHPLVAQRPSRGWGAA